MLRTPKSMVVISEVECNSYVAENRQAFNEVQGVRVTLLKRHKDRQKRRECRNAKIGRNWVGTRVVVGDKVLVKEPASVMARKRIHHKLAHEHWTLGGD